ncbi:MAG: acyloxyacyl hydrolase [Burkholderiales bacterium]|nr:acyloxyacyl hydrolase [Burkholderiales bacterium]
MKSRSYDGFDGIRWPGVGSMRDVACHRSVLCLLLTAASLPLAAQPASTPGPVVAAVSPVSFSIQAGATSRADSLTLAVSRDWDRQWQTRLGTITGYWELSIGRWFNRNDGPGMRDVTQIGVTPVLRLYPHWAEHWFAELGIGLNLITPHYSSGGRSFSSKFNFGDHIAIGRRFGAQSRQEIALRVQHFSNAGIDHPNPGENFIQLRYTQRW